MGLQTEFPILIYDLSTDAIIGTDTLGSVLPHTLDIKNGLLFMDGGVSLQLHIIDTALSGRVFTVGHCSIPPYSESELPTIYIYMVGITYPDYNTINIINKMLNLFISPLRILIK